MEEDPPDTLLSGQMSDEEQKEIEKLPNFYNSKSFGPFKVFINIKSDNESNYISPILIGKILINGKVKGIKEIKKLGKKKITVEFESGDLANSFIKSKINGLDKYNIYIPQHLMSSTGVVMIDRNVSDKEIMENLIVYNRKIIQVRRLNKRVVNESRIAYEPSAWVAVTIDGTTLPKFATIYKNYLEFRTFTRQIVICNRCLYYGHSTTNCKSSKPRCTKCSSEEHGVDECECDDTYCFHCKTNDHSPIQKNKCREFEKQKRIKEMMTQYNISFEEARMAYNGNLNLSPLKNPLEQQNKMENMPFAQHFPNSLQTETRNLSEVLNPPTKSARYSYLQATTRSNKPEEKKRKLSPSFTPPSRDCFFQSSYGPSSSLLSTSYYNQPKPDNNNQANQQENVNASSNYSAKQPSFFANSSNKVNYPHSQSNVAQFFNNLPHQFKQELINFILSSIDIPKDHE